MEHLNNYKEFLNESNEDYAELANRRFKVSNLRDKIKEEDIDKIRTIVKENAEKYGDSGSVVLGGKLLINGDVILTNWVQGNLGFEAAAKEIEEFIEKNYPDLKVSFEEGSID